MMINSKGDDDSDDDHRSCGVFHDGNRSLCLLTAGS